MRFLAVLALALLTALPAAARPLSPDEAESLSKSANGYLNAIKARNAEKIVAAIPPRIVNIFAGTAGVEAKAVSRTLVEQTRELLKGSRFSDVAANTEAIEGNDATLEDGTSVTWAIVPATFTAEVGGNKTRNDLAMVAISEAGKWYFVRIDAPQQKQIVQIAYPFLSDVAIPDAQVTPIQ